MSNSEIEKLRTKIRLIEEASSVYLRTYDGAVPPIYEPLYQRVGFARDQLKGLRQTLVELLLDEAFPEDA